MGLTRNLYREDEVVAALRLSVARGRTREAAFWVQEGIESGMDVVILQTLLRIWLYNVGVENLSWLAWFLTGLKEDTPFTEEHIIALTVSLVNSMNSRGDSTVFAMLAIGMGEPTPDRVGFTVLPENLRMMTLTKEEITFVRAILQGKFVLAWNLSRPLWESGRAEQILEAMDSPQFHLETLGPLYSADFLWDFRALSIVIANVSGCLHRPLNPIPSADPTILQLWNQRALLPMRERRELGVPSECLYFYTDRGSLKTNQSTDVELRHRLESALKSSNFWSEFESNFTDSGIQREEFYETYFPNDIPDEWSTTDRAKSHGLGVIPVGPHDASAILRRTLQIFYRVPSKRIWNGLETAIATLVKLSKNDLNFHDFYQSMKPQKTSVWDMSAVKKELYAI